MKRNLPALLVISDHLPIPAKPGTYKPALSLLRTLSRQWSVYFYHTDPFGAERTYQEHLRQRTEGQRPPPPAKDQPRAGSSLAKAAAKRSPCAARAGGPGIRIFPLLPESDQNTALQGLKEFLSGHDIDLILFLGSAAAQAHLREIRLFYPHRPVACLFFDPREAKQDLKPEKIEEMKRVQVRRSLEELYSLSNKVFVNGKSCSGERLNQALKDLVKKASSNAAASADRTSVIFVADGPRHMARRSFQVLRHNTPSAKEWIRAGKGNVDDVNNALRAAGGDFIALVRSNSLVTPGWLDGFLRCFTDTRVGAARPSEYGNRDYSPRLWTGCSLSRVQKDLTRLSVAWSLNHGNNEEKKSPHLNNSCWVLRRQAVERVGLLDRRFQWGDFAYWDYSLRLRQAGFKMAIADDIVIPRAVMNKHEDNVQREILAEKWVDAGLKILDELDGRTR